MWICTHCRERLHDSSWTCWRCCSSRLKPANAYRPRDITSRQDCEEIVTDEAIRYSRQVALREIFGLTTVVALCCAFFVNFQEDGVVFAALVIAGNAFGAIVGLMVTHVGGLPTDGSNPVEDSSFSGKP